MCVAQPHQIKFGPVHTLLVRGSEKQQQVDAVAADQSGDLLEPADDAEAVSAVDAASAAPGEGPDGAE